MLASDSMAKGPPAVLVEPSAASKQLPYNCLTPPRGSGAEGRAQLGELMVVGISATLEQQINHFFLTGSSSVYQRVAVNFSTAVNIDAGVKEALDHLDVTVGGVAGKKGLSIAHRILKEGAKILEHVPVIGAPLGLAEIYTWLGEPINLAESLADEIRAVGGSSRRWVCCQAYHVHVSSVGRPRKRSRANLPPPGIVEDMAGSTVHELGQVLLE